MFGLFSISAPQTQNFNPISIVLFAPLMSVLWTWLSKRGLEPSIPVKFSIALMGVGAFNYVFTQTLLATNPELQTIR